VILLGGLGAWLLKPPSEPPAQGRIDPPTTSPSTQSKTAVATNPDTRMADASGADAAARTDSKSSIPTDAAVPNRDAGTVPAVPDRRSSLTDPAAVPGVASGTRGSEVRPRPGQDATRDGGSGATGNRRNGTAAVGGANGPTPGVEARPVIPQNQQPGATGAVVQPAVERDERADRAAILDLVKQFADAYARQDEVRLKQIDPQFGQIQGRGLIRSVTATFSSIVITFGPTGDTASLTAAGTLNYVWMTPTTQPISSLPLAWKLRKNGTTWAVVP